MKAENAESKRIIFPILLAILIMISIGIIEGFAGISKEGPDEYCNICHTGGNATDGTTNKTCIECHSSSESSTYYNLGGYRVPVVNYTGPDAPPNYLAGGNFYWVSGNYYPIDPDSPHNDNRGHNIFPENPDDVHTIRAPGNFGRAEDCGSGSCHFNLDKPFMNYAYTGLYKRQGCIACHMLDDVTGPKGFHHADDSDTVVGSERNDTDGYYRFLKGHGSYGVSGIKDPTWQLNPTSTEHNEYLGRAGGNDHSTWPIITKTITSFCCGCHGNFHKQEKNGKWVRHPSDAPLPDSGEYKGYTTYNPEAPVARPYLGSINSKTVELGEDLVTCISCHRPHGSPYPDILRWDPSTCDGCIICHTQKSSSKGPCNKCHTMHYGQDGAPIELNGQPNPYLTLDSCLDCHGINDGETIAYAPNIFGYPNSFTMTAGGTFNDAIGLADEESKRHDVIDIWPGGDETSGYATPGTTGSKISVGPTQLTCAGATGCHGDHTKRGSDEGIKGFHHSGIYAYDADPNTQDTRSAKGYRYCQTADATPKVIEGMGSADWELGGATETNHNVYAATDENGTYAGISELCAQCHGLFHSTDNTSDSSPFKHHPTDHLIPFAWNEDTENPVNISYEYNPFAFEVSDFSDKSTVTDYESSLDAGEARVACVSCHRAHGSQYKDMLRWDPDKNENNGCTICHTQSKGPCNICHTMHYSQKGGVLSGWGKKGPYGYLLNKKFCLICHSDPISKVINPKAGWSMISLPVIPEDSVVSELFSEAVVIYGYEKGVGCYKPIIKEEDLEVEKGYWILFSEDKNYILTGEFFLKYTLQVYEDGWYMIGGCTSPARASINSGNIVVIYGYVPGIGYKRVLKSENLDPGKGYWILLGDIADQAELMVKGHFFHFFHFPRK